MKHLLLPLFIMCFVHHVLSAQVPFNPQDHALYTFSTTLPNYSAIDVHIPAPQMRSNSDKQVELFALPFQVDISPTTAGTWYDLPEGGRIWRLFLHSEDGKGTALLFDQFRLPKGAVLRFRNLNSQKTIAEYSDKNNTFNQRFISHFIEGKSLVLEYYQPKWSHEVYQLHISRIERSLDNSHQQKSLLNFGFGSANECHTNINCVEGESAQDVHKGVVRIMMVLEEGTGWCSGSLVNTTAQDGTPYILSAYHCQDGYTPLYDFWRFDFAYQSITCDNPTLEPVFHSLVGCTPIASRAESDFLLLETYDLPSLYWGVKYNGWNNANVAPSSVSMVHHPRGDIKKFSLDDDAVLIHPNSISWNNNVTTPPNYHLKATFDLGSFEIGSSGAPVFDQNNRIVGQLHGGVETCENSVIYAGRINKSWDEGATPNRRLRDWLDPQNTGATTADIYTPTPAPLAEIAGTIINENGVPIVGVQVHIAGNTDTTLITGIDGTYAANMPTESAYLITFQKDATSDNGVTSSDLFKILKHTLVVDTIYSPYLQIAADVSANNSVNAYDLFLIQRVILQLDEYFMLVPNWQFVPAAYQFTNPLNPWETAYPDAFSIPLLLEDIGGLDVIGIKSGDATGNADPSQ